MYALEANQIRKTYGGVVALERADLLVRPGSVHALLGGNGAGKSTLVKIITGAVQPDAGSGRLQLSGETVSFSSTAEAVRRGVAVVSQEGSLFPDLDVLSNLFPMREPRVRGLVSRAQMQKTAAPVLEQLGLHVSPLALLGTLSLAERQLVEIARALVTDPRVLVLDEPTSALEASSAGRLLDALRVLRERNVAVVFVSHILQEVMDLCDEVTVLRDGRVVLAAAAVAQLDVPQIVEAMLGERPRKIARNGATRDSIVRDHAAGDGVAQNAAARDSNAGDDVARVTLENVSLPGVFEDDSFSARAGEIVGLTGIAGAGHLGVIELVAGLRRAPRGSVTLPGMAHAPQSLRDALAGGVAYVSGDRKRIGLMLDKPIWENIAQVRFVGMAREGVLLRSKTMIERAQGYVAKLGIRTSSVLARADSLSGGNQQKVVMAKWLELQPKVLLLDDPTRGVDVGAKAEMHAILRELSKNGAVTLLCSTDLEELTQACDRVLVFFRGSVCAELRGEQLTENHLLEVMNTGLINTGRAPLVSDGA